MFVLPVSAPRVVVYPPVLPSLAPVKEPINVQPLGVVTVPPLAEDGFCPTTKIKALLTVIPEG